MQLRLSPTNFALLFTIAIPVAASFGIGRVSVLGASSADLQLRRSGTLSVCHTSARGSSLVCKLLNRQRRARGG